MTLPKLPKLEGTGHVGRIRIRESGKCELCIGDLVFDISSGIQSNMLQKITQTELMGEPKLIDYGEVTSKLVASLQIRSTG